MDTEHRRASFDQMASLYDENRPGYPDPLFDDLVRLSRIPPDGRILEIGCGTGHATLPLARRGYRILAIEIGGNMAAFARAKLAPWPLAEVVVGDFEVTPIEKGAFDLAISASAFHWIDPAIGVPKVARALKQGGSLALWGNGLEESESSPGFFDAVEEIYRREAPGQRAGVRMHSGRGRGEMPSETGLFQNVRTMAYHWNATYDAAGYLRFIGTYSGHATMDPATRDRLFDAIAELIDTRYGGHVEIGFVTTMHIAEVAR